MPKSKPTRKRIFRHNPLCEDILEASGRSNVSHKHRLRDEKNKNVDTKAVEEAENDEGRKLPTRISMKLLKLAEDQIMTPKSEDELSDEDADADGFVVLECEEDQEEALYTCSNEAQMFSQTRNLADIVMERLKQSSQNAPSEDALSPKVVEVYTGLAPFLAHYKSGKVPKAFKIIPRLHAWEEVLMLTNPPLWSKPATRVATKIFSSNLRESMAQRFFCTVLLPAVRDDIAEHKKLNYHLYMALKKALFKPGAFFKGIYLPLALEGCSTREGIIIGSVIAKVSIPVLHASAALIRLASVIPEKWMPSLSHMMCVLIEKKYSLPIQVIEECVLYFHRFISFLTKLTLSWHKCLLTFIQRYKFHLSTSQKAKFKDLLKIHYHEKVGPEIRKELTAKNVPQLLEQQQRALLIAERDISESIEVD